MTVKCLWACLLSTLIAVDTRGHGRSTLGEQAMTYPLLADDMARLLDELGTGPVTVVGHSDGGVIGYILAAKYPEKVRALVANGANFRKAGRGGLTPQINEWIKTLTPVAIEQWGDIRPRYEGLNPEIEAFAPILLRFLNRVHDTR